jgi:hypothetical protein
MKIPNIKIHENRPWEPTSTKHEEHGHSIRGERQAEVFLKKPSARKETGELLDLSKKQLRILIWLLTGRCRLKGHPFQLSLVYSPKCDRYKQASATVPHVLCDCEALATSRFRHLGRHSVTAGYFEDISASRILRFAQGAELMNESAEGPH